MLPGRFLTSIFSRGRRWSKILAIQRPVRLEGSRLNDVTPLDRARMLEEQCCARMTTVSHSCKSKLQKLHNSDTIDLNVQSLQMS